MGENMNVYQKASGRMSKYINAYCGKDPLYSLSVRCHEDEYLDCIDVVCGGIRCAGYNVIDEKSNDEPGEPYYVICAPTVQTGAELFVVRFVVDNDAQRFVLANEQEYSIYSLLMSLAIKLQYFGNGDRIGFERITGGEA